MWQVLGQERVVALLQRGLAGGGIAHAYLIVGPQHIGKMTLAVDVARAVNCEAQDRPCGGCRSCMRIGDGKHPDVQVLELQTQEGEERTQQSIGIDRVRELQRTAPLMPFEGRSRVFIINGAEHLSGEAANCLLKVLEEPPAGVLLLLLTSNEQKVLPTVRSRCQRLELRPLPEEALVQHLTERQALEEEQARLIARLSGGRPGWAFTALADTQLLSERRERLAQLLSAVEGSQEERFEFASRLAGRFSKSREEVRETLALWVSWWRDLLLLKGGCDEAVCNIDEKARLTEQAEGLALKDIAAFIKVLEETITRLEQNVNPRLALEVLMLSLPAGKRAGVRQGV